MISKKAALAGTATLIAAAAAQAVTGTMDNAVLQWNNVALQAIRDTHPGPPIVARALFVLQTCEFDAWAAYDGKAVGTRLNGQLRRPPRERTDANKTQAVSYGAYRALVDLFPSRKADFDAKMVEMGYDPANVSTDTATPAGVGNVACNAVLGFRHADGSNQLGDLHSGAYTDYTGYAPVNSPDAINDPNHWQPLTVSDGHGGTVNQTYIAPHWGNVTPFALQSLSQYRIKTPAWAGSAAYTNEANEVLGYSANLTDTQKVIAEYWADGPSSELPPGHWNLFAQFVSHRDAHSLDTDVKMFFVMNNALMDASVWTWGIKRQYDYVRPVTSIHYLFGNSQVLAWAGPGQGTQWIPGSAWRPYQAATVVTPPFPEYVSGHSTFSAAAASALRNFTGNDLLGTSVTVAAGTSRVEPGLVPAAPVTLTWATFTDAANEAGISRRYGGIHFVDADLEGRRVGKLLGTAAYKTSQNFIRGF